MAPIVLQKQRTLDEVLLVALNPVNNHGHHGCNWILIFNLDGTIGLTLGCDGVRPNLLQGDSYLLYNFYESAEPSSMTYLGNKVVRVTTHPETKRSLLLFKSCSNCGGFAFADPPNIRSTGLK